MDTITYSIVDSSEAGDTFQDADGDLCWASVSSSDSLWLRIKLAREHTLYSVLVKGVNTAFVQILCGQRAILPSKMLMCNDDVFDDSRRRHSCRYFALPSVSTSELLVELAQPFTRAWRLGVALKFNVDPPDTPDRPLSIELPEGVAHRRQSVSLSASVPRPSAFQISMGAQPVMPPVPDGPPLPVIVRNTRRPDFGKPQKKDVKSKTYGSSAKRKAGSAPSTKRPKTAKRKISSTPAKRPKSTKPDPHCLHGVVFAISGLENPRRSEIREKALDLGADYEGTWNRRCTHLVCVFSGTPKHKSATKSNAIIVQPEWVEACAKDGKRVDERKFALADSGKRNLRSIRSFGSISRRRSYFDGDEDELLGGEGEDDEHDDDILDLLDDNDEDDDDILDLLDDDEEEEEDDDDEMLLDDDDDDDDEHDDEKDPHANLGLPKFPDTLLGVSFFICGEDSKLKQLLYYLGANESDLNEADLVLMCDDSMDPIDSKVCVDPSWVYACHNNSRKVAMGSFQL